MSEHTPTPWKLKHKIDPTAVSGITKSAGFDAVIANCGGWSSNTADPDKQRNEQVANAAFIVRACNAHEALVEALAFYVMIFGNTAASITRESAREAYESANSALALARGEAVTP